MPKQKQPDEQVVIQGPTGDLIQIGRDAFGRSHYAEQGYEIVGPTPEDDPDAPKDVPHPDAAE